MQPSAPAPSTAEAALNSLGVALPPLPLPALTVAFNKDAFLKAHPESAPLCAGMIGTQLFVAFIQQLLPLPYRFNPHAKGGNGGGSALAGYQPMDPPRAWLPATADPAFPSRLPPSVRLFNAKINDALNRDAASKRGGGIGGAFGRSSSKQPAAKLDTSFLTDTSDRLRLHLPIPPPSPPPLPVDIDAVLAVALAHYSASTAAPTAPVSGTSAMVARTPGHVHALSAPATGGGAGRATVRRSQDLSAIAAAAAMTHGVPTAEVTAAAAQSQAAARRAAATASASGTGAFRGSAEAATGGAGRRRPRADRSESGSRGGGRDRSSKRRATKERRGSSTQQQAHSQHHRHRDRQDHEGREAVRRADRPAAPVAIGRPRTDTGSSDRRLGLASSMRAGAAHGSSGHTRSPGLARSDSSPSVVSLAAAASHGNGVVPSGGGRW